MSGSDGFTVYCSGCGSSRLGNVVQGEQFVASTRYEGVGTALLVTELHQRSILVQLLHNGADLPARKPLRRKVRQQSHHVEKGAPLLVLCRIHHSTQHVTKVGR